jgi:hypothetical protein
MDDILSEPVEVDREVHDRLERLFGQTQSSDSTESEEPVAKVGQKEGVLAKVWNKVKGKRKTDVPQPEEHTDPAEDKEVVELSVVSEPDSTASQAFSDLLSDAGDEVEHISLEIVPGGASEEVSTDQIPEDRQNKQKISFWSQLREKISAVRLRRVHTMIERAETRRAHRKNRRLRIPKPGDHASSA